jgi:drug/metabolite transporter (DMT)-like permease
MTRAAADARPLSRPAIVAHKSHLGRVIFWMTAALLSFCAMAISIRALAVRLSVFEVLAIRSSTAIVLLGALLALRPALRPLIAPRSMWLHFARNGTHYIGQYMWALALTLLPLATVFSLEFTMPAWAALLATVMLHERMNPSRIGVVVLGLIGVLIILRPGLSAFHPAALLVLCAALAYAVSVIVTKQLTATQSSFAIVFWMNVMQLPMSLVGCSPDFPTRLTGHDVFPIIVLAVSGLSSHYCLSNAFRAGEAMVVVPMDFLRIPLIAALGWWIYGEPLDAFVFVGALVIVSGIVWNLRAETRRVSLPAADAPTA